MNKNKVTIVIPCYNIEEEDGSFKSFEGTINSIIGQSFNFEYIELILINNGSTDNTNEILLKLSKEYNNVKIFNIDKNSGGPATPRNIGIENSNTDYIMFLDCDDKFSEEAVKILYEEISTNDFDFVLSNYSISLADNQILDYNTGNNNRLVTDKYDYNLQYIVKFFWTGIYSLQFLRENNINFKQCYGEDRLFLADCIINSDNICLRNDFSSVLYTADNVKSHSHNFTKDKLLSYINTFDTILSNYKENKVNIDFFKSQEKDFILFILGFVLRCDDNYDNFKIVFSESKEFLEKYDDDIELLFHWKIVKKLILNNKVFITYKISNLINHIFYNKLFTKLFRNDDYS